MNFIIDLSSNFHRNFINDSILMIINRYIKFAKYIFAKKIWTIENFVDVMIDEIFTKYDRFVFIVFDKNSLFISNFWSIFCHHLWMKFRYNTIYHFQTNDQTKKQNQIFEIYLKCYVNYQQNDCTKWFNITKFAYNNNFHIVIDKTSFQMLYDNDIRLKKIVQKNAKKNISTTRNRTVFVTKTKRMFELKWIQLFAKTKKTYNKKRSNVFFKINEMIYLNVKNIKSIRSSKKFDYKYYESYFIFEFVDKMSYCLNFSKIMFEIHDVFHVFLLKSTKKNRNENSSFIELNDEKKWKIKIVMNMKKKRNKIFLIKWLKY